MRTSYIEFICHCLAWYFLNSQNSTVSWKFFTVEVGYLVYKLKYAVQVSLSRLHIDYL